MFNIFPDTMFGFSASEKNHSVIFSQLKIGLEG